jgi:hypothetical protein
VEEHTTGNVLIDGHLAAIYELTRRFQSRPVAIPVGHRITYRDLGGEGHASIVFPEIFSDALRSKLQRMIDAQVSIEERRRLRSEGGGVLVQLVPHDGSPLQAAVGPPSFPYQPADRASFPVSIAA